MDTAREAVKGSPDGPDYFPRFSDQAVTAVAGRVPRRFRARISASHALRLRITHSGYAEPPRRPCQWTVRFASVTQAMKILACRFFSRRYGRLAQHQHGCRSCPHDRGQGFPVGLGADATKVHRARPHSASYPTDQRLVAHADMHARECAAGQIIDRRDPLGVVPAIHEDRDTALPVNQPGQVRALRLRHHVGNPPGTILPMNGGSVHG